MLRTWGQQRRRILTGRRQFRDGGVHRIGAKGAPYSIKDLAGRAHWNTESLPNGMEPGLWIHRKHRRQPAQLGGHEGRTAGTSGG